MAGIPEDLKGRNYTRVSDWSRQELELALDLADELKQERARRKELRVLPGRTLGMIFHKPSTRTRVAFEVGIAELGGMALYLPAAALLIRTFEQAEVDEFAEYASIPVINGLTDLAHPLQALADAMTIRERHGGLEGVKLTYLGDGNNVCHSLMRLAARFGMHFTAACPAGYEPLPSVVEAARADAAESGGSVRVTNDPLEGADGADVLYTDVWTSMGQDAEREQRLLDLERFSLDGELVSMASREVVAMHCLPAHVGEEIAEDVLYGPRSLVWEQAENRLHTQKAVLALVVR
jgi:ornithine carbamoyltransferase